MFLKQLSILSITAFLLSACMGGYSGKTGNSGQLEGQQQEEPITIEEAVEQQIKYEQEREKEKVRLHNHADAQYEKGKAFCCGNTPPYSNLEATQWLCQAARRGHPDAQYAMGNIHRSDKENIQTSSIGIGKKAIAQGGFPSNDMLAYIWYRFAVRHEHPLALEQSRAIKTRLSRDDLNKAHQMMANYPAVPCEVMQ